MSKIKYIPEIDGLRTLAVLPVILYHLGLNWIPGGFLGVDVFFVISGYLITSILIKERNKNIFDFFVDFYIRRLRRIFPAFFTVVITTILVSYFILLPQDFIELGRSALAGVGFVSNIYFYLNTGYFDAPAETMPLLHTWSLAVEEQFYLVWPALILLTKYLGNRSIFLLLSALFLSSFVSSLWLTPLFPAFAFYNLPFRVFQFLLGATIPLFISHTSLKLKGSRNASFTLQFIGVLLISFSYIFFSKHNAFPGWLAIIPSLGAALFILGTIITTRTISNPMKSSLMVGIGKISFSLYLCHWPVITLYKIYSGENNFSILEITYLSSMTLFLSLLSYKLIEQPFRNPKNQKTAIIYTLGTAACTVFAFVLIVNTKGFSNRLPDARNFASPSEMWRWDCPATIQLGSQEKSYCNFGVPWGEAERKIILWGDSHAQQLSPLLEIVASQYNLSFLLFPSGRPLADGKDILVRHKNPNRATKGILNSKSNVYEIIKSDPQVKLVVLAGAWMYSPSQMYTPHISHPSREDGLTLMRQGLKTTVLEVNKLGADVLLFGDIPVPGPNRFECSGENTLLRKSKPDCGPIPLEEITQKQGATEKALEEIANQLANVQYHNIIANHCINEECDIFVNNEYFYRDADHIRRNLSTEIKHKLIASFGLEDAIMWRKYSNN